MTNFGTYAHFNLYLVNWISVGGMEFAFNNDGLTSDGAEALCTTIGGKLYEPRDASVMQDVTNQAKTAGINEFWIGINDKDQEGTFVYSSDKTPLSITNWAFGEPNNAHDQGEHCAVIRTHDGTWVDLHCTDYERSTVCMRAPGKYF